MFKCTSNYEHIQIYILNMHSKEEANIPSLLNEAFLVKIENSNMSCLHCLDSVDNSI